MKNIPIVFSWIFGIICFLLFLLSLFSKHYIPSILILFITVLLIPPFRQYLNENLGFAITFWWRLILIPILFVMYFYLILQGMGNKYSIYKNPVIEKKLMAIYENKMEQWPVPHESIFIDTRYGQVHVIISGPENAPPLLLCHASAMASWSWLYNIKGLNKFFRTYAIDTIGDAGRSNLINPDLFPKNGKELADLYNELLDILNVEKGVLIGASQGGFISTNLALYYPEKVEKLILCGPMGYSGTNLSVLRILFTTMFPIKPIQRSAIEWAFGDDPELNKEVGDWFSLILEGVIPRQARPQTFGMQQLEQLEMPVLLLLGKKDGLVGDPENTRQLINRLKNFNVEILNTGHLISAEEPDRFNNLVIDFIRNN